MKGVTVIDRQTGEEYDPLPLARFLPIPSDILSILHRLGNKIKSAHRTMRGYEFTPEEEELRKQAGDYFQRQLFDNLKKDADGEDNKSETKEKTEEEKVQTKDNEEEKKESPKKSKKYFFKLSHMSPKDIMIHLCRPVESGQEITQRIISR